MSSILDESKYTKLKDKPKKDKIKKQIQQVLTSQLYGVLATSNKNQPYTSLLAFVASDDIKNIYLATGKSTYKFQNLNENQRIAFFIDTRANDNFDISNAYALTAIGKAKPINKNQIKDIKEKYLGRHPHLKSFIQSENIQFIQLKISSFSFVERFQNVYLLEMDDEFNSSTS